MEEESPPQPDSIPPQPAMESRDENPQRVSPQFEEVVIRQSIRSADEPITEEFDRSDEEGSIPVPPKLDDGGERRSSTAEEEGVKIVEENLMAVEEDEPQVYERDERVSSLKEEEGNLEAVVAMEEEKAPVVEPSADEAMEENTEEKSPDREISLLAAGDEKEEEAVTVEEGKYPITEPSVDEIMQENAEEKPLDVSEPTPDKELNGERSLLAEGDEKISSLSEEEEKRKPLVSVADIDEVMRDNIDDAHEACSTEELNRERPWLVEGDSEIYSLQETLAEKDDKVSSLEQGLLGKEGEDKVDVPDDIMQEEVEDKPIELDGIHPSEQLDEEIPQSGEDVAKLSSLRAEFVGEKEKEPISELSVSTAAVNEIKHEKVEQELSEEQLKEETAASAGKSTEVSSLQQEQIDEDNKISALPEDSAEKDENVSLLKEESAEKDQEESAEKEEDDEVDTDEGGPAKAAGRRTGSKQKRGRPQVSNGRRTRAPSKPKEDEELCFICFDGGDLVVCDHRGCPKVYHPSCVNRDEEYFKAKGQWTCGWHICSSCQKSARYMCYTCTYSLCRGCIKESDFVCVRGNKGFCKECMKTVMLIEMNKHADDTMGVIDFDDKTSWMYLFKDYWVDLKAKLSLTTEELIEARNPLKETNTIFGNEKHLNKKRAAKWNEEPLENSGNASDDQGGSASSSSKRYKENASLRKKVKKRSRNTTREDQVKGAGTGQISNSEDIEWASKELLEFVEHMKDGDRSVLSQFDVQALLLEYIKQNNLRDPRRKSQIICDSRLWALFGKSRVGHLEMLKLLEPHFLIKEASPIVTDDNQGGVVDPEPSQTDADGNSDASTKISDLRRKSRRRVEEKGLMNPDDYAAIDVHNVSLMYLRRNLMEDFLDDVDTFKENVVGAFVRIRISGSTSAKDMYRLVQVVGTGKAAGKYKTGKKTTDITLEILNLNKREVITIDLISNQEFTEEECERLRQSVKCGFIDRPKVAEVQEKARALHTVRVDDWLESEKARLGHLRDRASEKGRKKEHRECVEKLQLLSTPEERIRRLNEVPEIHVDPNMDPDYDSTEDEEGQDAKREVLADNKKQKPYFKGRDEFSMGREGFNAHKNSLAAWDSNRNTSKAGVQGIVLPTVQADRTYGFSRNQGNDAHSVSSPRTPKNEPNATGMDAVLLKNAQPVAEPGQARGLTFETVPQQANIVSSSTSENEKMWHYQDPAGKVQGPFSMTQLRKWNASKFFPANLRIWRSSEKQEDSILLTDALSGKLHKDSHQQEPQLSNTTQPTNATAMLGSRANNMDGSVRENTTLQAVASSPATDNYNLVNSDKWTAHPSSLSVTNTGMASNHMDGRPAASSTGWESSKIYNAWPDQSQACNAPRPINPSSRNLSQQTSFHGRDGRGENTGRWSRDRSWQNNWNSNRHRRFQPNDRAYERQHPYQSSSRQQYRGEQWKGQPANDSSKQLGNGSFNPPANAPQPSNIDWASLQGALNRISASVQPACSGLGSDLQQSPANVTSSTLNSVGGWASNAIPCVNLAKTPENIGVLSDFQQQNKLTESAVATSASHAVYCGSNATESMDRSNRRQGLESSSSNTKPHSEQASVDVLNSESIQPANPQNDTRDHTIPMNEPDGNMKCPGAHDRSNPENKPGNNTVVGPASVAPNALGSSNLSDASVAVEKLEASSSSAPSSAHQQGPNSLSTNAAQPVNIGWGMAQQNSNPGTGTGQETGHLVHAAIPGAANMGWGMVTPGLVNIGWGPPAQPTMGWGPPAQPTMNPNLGWAIPTQGNVNANLAWGAQAMANPNAGWGMPMQVNPSAVNPGWFAPVIGGANPSPSWVAPTEGNTNQNAAWGTPVQGTGQGSMNGGASNQNGGGEGEQRGICNFHRHGYCKKGASCNYIHS